MGADGQVPEGNARFRTGSRSMSANQKSARLLRYKGIAVAGVFVVTLAAHVIWTRSGSNEWQVVSDADGIRISTLKTPGESSLRYRANMQVDSRLSDVVAFL